MVDTFVDKLLYFVWIVCSLFEVTCENAKFHATVHSKNLKNLLMILFCAFTSLRCSGQQTLASVQCLS